MKTNISQPGTIGNFDDIQPLGPSVVDFSIGGPMAPVGPFQLGVAAAPVITLSAIRPADFMLRPAVTMASVDTASSQDPAGGVASSAAALATGFSGSVTYAPLVITPVFGASITNLGTKGTKTDPTTTAEVEAAINAAVNYYEKHWRSSVPVGTVVNGSTINSVAMSIEFDYGTLGATAMTAGDASTSSYNLSYIGNGHYPALLSAMSGVLPNLPASDPTGGTGIFLETTAQSELLGLTTAGTAVAGDVGLNSVANGIALDWNLSSQSIAGEIGAVGAIEHEISEVFGRAADLTSFGANTYSLFDLYRFKASNTPDMTAGAADYFSINGGTTALGYFNSQGANGGDAGDWASSGTHDVAADSFDAFLSTGTAGTISALDRTVLGNIGLQAAAACFVAGTLIETTRGPVAVERLRTGDEAILYTGGSRPIAWIGHRRMDFARHPEPVRALPIRIRAGALADGVPRRDLIVSPDHAMFLRGMLIPARLLVNGASIVRETRCDAVTYFHVELDRHDILLAEGAPAESYLDTGNRAMFENCELPLRLHPDFSDGQRVREAASRAPFVETPAEVEPVWSALAGRAQEMGWALPEGAEQTDDPDPHVVIGSRRIRPLRASRYRYTFVIPADSAPARLISRSACPHDACPWVSDDRRLGVKVRRLIMRRGGDALELALDDPMFSRGWWAAEWDDGRPSRWTNGDASLPPLRAGVLDIELTGLSCYPARQFRYGNSAISATPRLVRNVA